MIDPGAVTPKALAAALDRPDGRWPRRTWALLDVREAGEAERGHIPGATPLPRRLLEFRAPEVIPDRSVPVVLYDTGRPGDSRATHAGTTLVRHGHMRVLVLAGGIAEWQAAGGRIASGVNVPCKAFGERVLAEDGIPYLTADDLAPRLQSSFPPILCDVRTPEEFAAGHVPGGKSLPGFELALRLDDLLAAHRDIVVSCAGRTRSIIATATLRLLGAAHVLALENGTMGWQLSGRELARGGAAGPASPSRTDRVIAAAEALARAAGVAVAQLGEDILASGGYVFDVRSLADFAAGHLPGSVALPGGQAVQRADDFAAAPGRQVTFVDDGDARAWLAGYWFARMGFPRVRVLAGGLPAWRSAGGAIALGRGRPEPLGLARAERTVPRIDAATLAALVQSRIPPLVLDVGTSRQVQSGHVPGARWLPRGWLEDRFAAVPRTDGPVVATARDPAQAVLAAATLIDRGHQDVAVLDGGVPAWIGAGFETATGLPAGADDAGDIVEPPYAQGPAAMRRYLAWEIGLQKD